ncbi:MAG: hypothetical protein WBA12_04575, partial [Catalinimonas sp.]
MRFTTLLLLCSLLLSFGPARAQGDRPAEAQYVWTDADGQGRHAYAVFRRTFDLPAVPEEATINLYAA